MRILAAARLALGLILWSGAVVAEEVQVAPPFHLETTAGAAVDSADLDGRPYGLFFGFTHCPDVCPTTFAELGLALASLGDAARDFRIYFVSIDPERDTPQVLSSYLAAFDPRIVALVGEASDQSALADGMNVVRRRVPLAGGDYTMEHTASVFLIDGDGLVADRIAYSDGADVMAARIKGLIDRR